ncbi:MAG: TIGR00296 family protein [Euryarchaeota archaeon]|nr:TIGR00296 family protein [Euryarchaeota archaeon]
MKDSEGELAVRMAREVVEAEAKGKSTGNVDAPESFQEKRGVFVTLHTYPDNKLRGCIGFPEPIFSLASALIQASQHACHDPRFKDLHEDELDDILVEVSILTPPEEVTVSDPTNLPDTILVGQDGLIVERGPFRGLLLPQVPVEWNWDAEEFLAQTCLKAGMSPDMWMDKRTTFYTFQAEVFSEETPRGKVSRKDLGE